MPSFGAAFCLSNLFHFYLNKQFQNMFCCRYFKVLKVVWCRCFWVFKLSFAVDIFGFFDLATFWAILWKIWWFFSNHLVTLERWNLLRYLVRHKTFSYMLRKEMFYTEVFRLRYFAMLCNMNEYKRMTEVIVYASHTM